ncbi:MAG: GAF domain-containing protein [Deltaproteobacteria bacterium]|nr:GAF domain-containing protein [Deltaproteobacteria bacterium]
MSIRNKIFALALLGPLPFLLFSIYWLFTRYEQIRVQAGNESLRLARAISQDVDGKIRSADRLVPVLADHPALQQLRLAEASALFRDQLARNPELTAFVLSDPEGRALATAVQPQAGELSPAPQEFFRRVSQSGRRVVGPLLIARSTGRPLGLIGYPVKDRHGRVTAVLAAGMDLQKLWEGWARLGLPRGGAITLFDDRGTVLARAPDSYHWVGKPIAKEDLEHKYGTYEAFRPDGVRLLVAAHTAETAPWTSAVSIQADLAYAPARQELLRMGVVVLTMLVLSLGLTVLISGPIIGRLRRVASSARAIAQGRYGEPLPEWPRDELGEVAQQFNIMSRQVRSAHAELEEQVREATGELLRRNEQLAALNAIFHAASSTLRLDELLGKVLREVTRALDLDAGVIYLADQETEAFDLFAYHGLSEAYFQEPGHAPQDETCNLLRCLRERRTLVTPGLAAPGLGRSLSREGMEAIALIPLANREEPLGVMGVGSRTPRAFAPGDLEFLDSVGSQVGVAIANARLYDLALQERDLERRTADERRLAALIELAAAAAHELRQPMSVILARAELLLQGVPKEDPLHGSLTVIVREIERMNGIIQDLGRISGYQAKPYPGGLSILDLKRSAESDEL